MEGGYTKTAQVTPALSLTQYAAGDLMGGKLTLADFQRFKGGSGQLQTLVLTDLDNEKAAIDVIFFAEDPVSTTFTDNAAFDVADADLPKILGRVSIGASDYTSFADNAEATKAGLGLAWNAPSGSDLYCALVCRGTPTYTSAGDLQLRVTTLQD